MTRGGMGVTAGGVDKRGRAVVLTWDGPPFDGGARGGTDMVTVWRGCAVPVPSPSGTVTLTVEMGTFE